MEQLKKHWWLILFVIGMIGNEVRKARQEGRDLEIIKSVTFTDPKIRIVTEDHINDLPTPEQIAYSRILDSINTTSAIKSRALRDEVFKKQAKRDSATAVTIFQMKEEIKKLKSPQ